ncbi:hypothetical protein HZS_7737 [Henneguya salminicola]|nr:hypothetical protein HZS_7737 [Henneguya salminicola]
MNFSVFIKNFLSIYNKIDGKNNMKFKILKQMLKSSKENFSENIKIFEEILSYYNGSTTRLKFERLVTGWLNSFYNLSFVCDKRYILSRMNYYRIA